MAQLVSNLVGNAVQHGHQDTPVKITTSGADPDSVTVVVENQGPVIPLEHRSSIFDPLNRTSQASDVTRPGSLGLGLYIAREIALAHGGSLKLLSSDESGTSFQVRLPRVAAVT
jgi:signal transduction histidine kinase